MTAVDTSPRAWIAEQLDELHVHGAVALAGADPEGVHQLDRFRGDTEGFSRAELVAFERLMKGLRAERGVACRRATLASGTGDCWTRWRPPRPRRVRLAAPSRRS
jgi:hypothetical protein